MIVQNYLDSLYYNRENSSDNICKAGFIYTIIEIKRENLELKDYGNTIYVDVKCFLDCYIMGVASDTNGDYGYDEVSLVKVLNAIDIIDNINQRIALYDRTLNLLKSNSLYCLAERIKQEKRRYSIIQLYKKKTLLSWIRGLGYLSIYNVWTILCVLFFVFCSYYMLTLPLSDENSSLFVIEHQEYCNNIYVNHLMTYFAGVLDLTDKTFCRAKDILGFLILLTYKLFFILFGGWNAVDIIKQKLSISNGND